MTTTSALGAAIAELRSELDPKQVSIGDVDLDSEVREYVSTQCPLLDIAIGRSGIPVGRLTTIMGLEGTGKSSLLIHILAETQQRGGIAVLADTERRYWKERAARLGLDQDMLLHLTGGTVEEIITQIHTTLDIIRKVHPDILVTVGWDSLAGTPTKADIEADSGDVMTANYARVMRPELRKLHPKIAAQRTALVIVNQMGDEINFFGFGKPKLRMVAQKTLTYWSSLQIMLTQQGKLGPKEAPTGTTVKAEVVSSRIAPPYKSVLFDMDFNTGIDKAGAALDSAVQCGLIEKSGGWFKWRGKTFHRGDFAEIYNEDEELRLMVAALPTAWIDLLREQEEA